MTGERTLRWQACIVPLLWLASCGARSSLDTTFAESGVDQGDAGSASPRDATTPFPALHDASGPTCPTCAAGESECRPGGVSTCRADRSGCGTWGEPVACGPSQTCV